MIHVVARLVDICLPTLDKACFLTGLEEADAIADFHLALGVKHLVLKMGSDGALYASSDQRLRVAGHRVDTVDATGAGDCFSGAFLTQFLNRNTPADAPNYANAAVALTNTDYGVVVLIPSCNRVEAFIHSRS
ncbi:PfkB family carbohydrate kinase [Klebsiella pneumoniae]